ncbi:MAG: winged helix-turn-helix transcriptional regulator [Planctomycetota bacterium]|nr:winged helix-turn-helix transcriptional regulator [Planctomycetota bacterium]
MKTTKPSACCPPNARRLQATPEHVNAFKALAHEGRLRVFFYLVRANKPVPANEVQAELELPAPTLSHHLDDLERAGLIERERRERYILSSVNRAMVVELVRLLTACC